MFGNRTFTIVQPGYAQRSTSCDNTLKGTIASFTDRTVPERLFEARRLEHLDRCQAGV